MGFILLEFHTKQRQKSSVIILIQWRLEGGKCDSQKYYGQVSYNWKKSIIETILEFLLFKTVQNIKFKTVLIAIKLLVQRWWTTLVTYFMYFSSAYYIIFSTYNLENNCIKCREKKCLDVGGVKILYLSQRKKVEPPLFVYIHIYILVYLTHLYSSH